MHINVPNPTAVAQPRASRCLGRADLSSVKVELLGPTILNQPRRRIFAVYVSASGSNMTSSFTIARYSPLASRAPRFHAGFT